jgi:cyclin A
MEYSDPDLEDLDEAQVNGLYNFSALNPVSDAVFRTALHDEQAVDISCQQFLTNQHEMLPRYREVAVKWLLRLNERFEFAQEAVYDGVRYFDQLSMRIAIPKPEIQVYAAVCYCLAVKIDTRTSPTVEELNALSGQSFTKSQLAEKELEIVQSLSFRLSYPTCKYYLRIFLDALLPGENVVRLTSFLGELSLMKFGFLDFRPSIVALSIMIVASAGLGFRQIADNAIQISHSSNRDEVLGCVAMLKTETEEFMKSKKGKENPEFIEFLAAVNFEDDFTSLVFPIKR